MSVKVVLERVNHMYFLQEHYELCPLMCLQRECGLTAVTFSFLKYGLYPTDMTIGQTLPSSSINLLFSSPSMPGLELAG